MSNMLAWLEVQNAHYGKGNIQIFLFTVNEQIIHDHMAQDNT